MKPALFFTAYDRPGYLREALNSWTQVRGLDRWRVVAMIEPGMYSDQIRDMFNEFFETIKHPDFEVLVNPQRYGVLHHPWVGFERLFASHEFVVRTEDDLRVSSDIIEYFEWAEERFRNDPYVASIHGFTYATHGGPGDVQVCAPFNPLVWGTWRDRWRAVIGPTWDHDYSTNNGTPMVQAGWDWNLNTRVYPQHGWSGAYPLRSRVDNIGLHGTHSTPDNFSTSASFHLDHGDVTYREVSDADFVSAVRKADTT